MPSVVGSAARNCGVEPERPQRPRRLRASDDRRRTGQRRDEIGTDAGALRQPVQTGQPFTGQQHEIVDGIGDKPPSHATTGAASAASTIATAGQLTTVAPFSRSISPSRSASRVPTARCGGREADPYRSGCQWSCRRRKLPCHAGRIAPCGARRKRRASNRGATPVAATLVHLRPATVSSRSPPNRTARAGQGRRLAAHAARARGCRQKEHRDGYETILYNEDGPSGY